MPSKKRISSCNFEIFYFKAQIIFRLNLTKIRDITLDIHVDRPTCGI